MQYDFTILSNGGQKIDAKGRFIKYKSGTGKIQVRIDRGGYIDLVPGQGIKNIDFDSFEVRDKSGAANSGTIIAGFLEFQDDSVSGSVGIVNIPHVIVDSQAGTVLVRQNGKELTVAGSAFIGVAAFNTAVAQLWNPVGSGKNVVVEAIEVASSVANTFDLFSASVVAATSSIAAGLNKNVGGSASTAQVRSGINTGTTDLQMMRILTGANVGNFRRLERPILLVPGKGLTVLPITAGNQAINFEWTEE